MSLRVEDQLRYQSTNVTKDVKQLNCKGLKKRRIEFLNRMSKISILESDVTSELEQEMKLKYKDIETLHECLDNLNVEFEEWKKQY